MSAPASSSSASGGGGTAPAAWNLKHMLAKRLLRELISKSQSAARQSGGGGVVLVVDPHTSKILSSCLRMHDLLSAGVLVLQQLHLRRERVPELPAVYFVEPSAEALEVIAEDFPKPPPSATPAGKEHAGAGAIIEGAMQALHLKGGAGSGAAANGADPAKAAAAAAAANRCHYLCAHLFFTRSVSAKRMAWLSKDSGMDMRKVKSFVELGADFLAFESRVFLLDRPHTIPRLYPLPPDDEDQAAVEGPSNSELLPLVAQLLSVCSTVLAPGERPYVRYISAHVSGQSRSALSQRFAELVDRELTKAAKATAAASPSSPPPSAPRNTTLLVVDRSLDPLTPLMHEFTYQAMLNDLLKVQGEIVTLPVHQDKSKGKNGAGAGESGDGKQPPAAAAAEGEDPASSGEFVLSEDDALWCQYRHRHIGTVMAGVNRKLKEFAASNQMAQYQLSQAKLKGGKDGKGGKDSIKDVLKAVSSLPEYKQAMKGYAKHLALSEECLSKFTSRHLALVGELEQSVAANSTPEGVVYAAGSRELREALKALVLDRAPELEGRPLGLVDKLRLVVIFSLVHGGLPSNLQKVLSASLHPELVEAVLGEQSHLRSLGAQLDAFEVQVSRARIDELNERNLAQPLALMRYVPVLHGILEALLRNELPETMFPYTKVGGAPPKRDAGASGSNTPAHGMGSRRGSSSLSTTGGGGANEEQLRAKLLAEAEMDVAHRALGRSARRHKADRDPAAAAAAAQSLPATPAAAAAASSMSTDGLSSSADDPLHPHQHRYIVFMLGGLSFSEMRSSYEVSAAHGLATGSGPDAPLLVGSTAALTPAEYLLDVSGLTRKEFYDKVLASASTAAAHSIASSEQEHRPVLAAKGQRSEKALTEEEREERAARERMAEALRGTGDEEEDVSDVSDPGDSDDDFDSPSPPPVARGSAAHAKQSLMQSSAATSRNGAASKGKNGAPAAPAASASASAAKKAPVAASVAKKTKELVFESESEGEQRDGEDDEDDDAYNIDPSPSPSSARGGGAKAKGQAQVAAANGKGGKGSSRDPAPAPAAKGKGAASSSAAGTKKSSRRRKDSDDD